MKKNAFTLIELLVVIAIIALLLGVLVPALQKAKESAKIVVCRNHLKTLSMSNIIYADEHGGWFVAAVDTTKANTEPTWNSNIAFRHIVGVDTFSDDMGFQMPKEFLCPSDRQSRDEYWTAQGATYHNFVSYGYNFTDWGPYSRDEAVWSGNVPNSDWACQLKINRVVLPGKKIMFTDSGDIWIRMQGANYQAYWDRHGEDIAQYRSQGMWHPVYYRHKEGASVAYFDGHSEWVPKEKLFAYVQSKTSMIPNVEWNKTIWFCDPSNIAK